VFLGRSQVLGVLQSACRVSATKNGGVDFQHQVQLLKIKQVDTTCNVVVNQRIALKHIVQNFISQGITLLGKVHAQLGKAALHLTQCAFNRWQIKTMSYRHWQSRKR